MLEAFDGTQLDCRFVTSEVIGLGGCMVLCPQALPVGAEAEVRICLAGGVIRADCRVAYSRRSESDGYEIGLEFLVIPEADRPLLDAVVARGVVARAAASQTASPEPGEE